MESKYISRVLSHIKNKERRRAVDAELSDHLDEKGKEYLALGYEADGALSISETAMGDADVVGEQFDELLKSRTRSALVGYVFSGVVLLLTAAVCVVVFLMARSGGMFSYYFAYVNTVHQFSLLAAVLQAGVFALNLISMLIGIAKKRIANLSIGFTGAAGMIVFGAVLYYFSVSYYAEILDGFDIVGSFYQFQFADWPLNSGKELAFSYWLFFVFILLFGLSLWGIIRTRRLKNGRLELVLKKVLTGIVAAIALLVVTGAAVTVITVCANEKTVVSSVQKELAELEAGFLDRLDEYEALNLEDLNDGAFDMFNGYTVYDSVQPAVMDSYREPHDITKYGNSDYVTITLDTDEYNGAWYTVTTITADVLKPFGFTSADWYHLVFDESALSRFPYGYAGDWYYSIFNESALSRIPYGADIAEAPLPAKLCYYSMDDVGYEQGGTKRFIKLIYDAYEETTYLLYSFDEATGRFLLTENTEIPYEEEVTLTAEQRLSLTEVINERIVYRLFGDAHPAYALYSFYPLGVYYNADYDRYRIDLVAGMALTEPQYSSKEAFNEIISAVAQFRNGKCEIMSLNTAVLYEPEDADFPYSDMEITSADEEAKAILDARSQELFNADEIRERLHAQYSQYTDFQQALETFRDIPIPQSTEDVITLAQKYDYDNWYTPEDLEVLRMKPCFGYSINDSYDFETGISYGIGKSKWLFYSLQNNYLLTSVDWHYIRDISLGLTEDEFYRCCGIFAPYEYCETEDGRVIIALYFRDDEMWSTFYYTFENGILSQIEPSEEFAAKHQ